MIPGTDPLALAVIELLETPEPPGLAHGHSCILLYKPTDWIIVRRTIYNTAEARGLAAVLLRAADEAEKGE